LNICCKGSHPRTRRHKATHARLRSNRLLQGYDHRRGRYIAGTHIAVDGGRVEVNCVSSLNVVRDLAVLDIQLSGKQVEELATGVLVCAWLTILLVGQELSEVGVKLTVGDEISQAFEEVRGVGNAALRQTHTILRPMHAEER
jgi:hypothetical protein